MLHARFASGLGVLVPLLLHAPHARGGEAEENVRSLMARAEDGPSAARAEALEKLGRVGEKARLREFGVVEFLLRSVRDGRRLPRLRKKAVEALIAIARETDTSIRERVLGELAKLLEGGGGNTVRWKVAAEIWALVDPKGLGADKRAIAALERIVSGKEPPALRAAALRSLGHIGAPSSLDTIRAALSGRDKYLAQVAWETLEEYFGSTPPSKIDLSALGKVIAQHIDDSSSPPDIRAAAMKAVAHMGCKPAIPKIENVLKTEKNEGLVLAGVEALGIFAEPGTARTIANVYERFKGPEAARVRASACAALSDLYQPLAEMRNSRRTVQLVTNRLIDALYKDESVEVARAAAFGLGNLAICMGAAREKAIEALIDALVDPDAQVRKNARESLEELTLHAVVPRENETPEEYQERWKEWFEKNRRRFPD